jgi:hypothetical protein
VPALKEGRKPRPGVPALLPVKHPPRRQRLKVMMDLEDDEDPPGDGPPPRAGRTGSVRGHVTGGVFDLLIEGFFGLLELLAHLLP